MPLLLERERELAAVDALLDGPGGVLMVEGGAGIGKTALLDAACRAGAERGHEVLRACGSELEAGFAFGVVLQLLERRLTAAGEREALLAGPAAAARALFAGEPDEGTGDTSFAVQHGLYWVVANLAAARPLLLVVDDAHCADEPSLRWLAYLAARLEGLAVAVLLALRPVEPSATEPSLLALRTTAAVARPALLSEAAVSVLARGDEALGAEVWAASGGNPLYATELLRTAGRGNVEGVEGIAARVVARVRGVDAHALRFAQALAVLGDGAELRHAAALAGVDGAEALRLEAALARAEVLADGRFIHPVVREAIETSPASDELDSLHRRAAVLLHADGAWPGQVAAHLARVRPTGDGWVLGRLREAARAALQSGAPAAATALLERALAEPPPPAQRVEVLREAARAEAAAGRATACLHLERALALARGPRERAAIALEIAEAYAALFRWVDAVDVLERALAELGDADPALAARLEGELVVCGLHDARRAARVAPVLARLTARVPDGPPAEALAVARGMALVLAGDSRAAAPLEEALARARPRAENWDTRAALLWSLVAAERFDSVANALEPMLAEVTRSGSARGLVAAYSTLGVLNLRLGALPEADAAARVALRVLQEGDLAAGLAFAATVLAEVATAAGELAEAESLLGLLPQGGWPAGVGTVLIPAARGRLRLAQGRAADALADFRACLEMFSPRLWGTELRDVGYLHARSGAALALLQLGDREGARDLAQAELADVREFGTARALGIGLRVCGLVEGGARGLAQLREAAAVHAGSPALLERAVSLAELGAALRRDGQRAAAREPLAEALELAARAGARPLAARARAELNAAGARPRREWRRGVEALTPSELRIVRLAADGRTNREIAGELYITLKTVEGHLSRAYGKLGIDGRGGLPQALGGEMTRVTTP